MFLKYTFFMGNIHCFEHLMSRLMKNGFATKLRVATHSLGTTVLELLQLDAFFTR